MVGGVAVLALAACDVGDLARRARVVKAEPSVEASYLAPPVARLARRTADGHIQLSGSAAAGATVRLGQPDGRARSVVADDDGGWAVILDPSPEVRLFGLSMMAGSRVVQSEGYLAVMPDGMVAQLRAGAGSRVLSGPSRRPRILAIDYDRDGAAIVSGVGTAGADVGLRVDHTARGLSTVDQQGRFSIVLTQPLTAGPHEVEVAAEGGEDVVTVAISPAAPLTEGPFRGGALVGGWRIDWLTPGGGAQTTLLFPQAAG